jgi:hypothetical protein
MTDPTPDAAEEFDGCSRECRKAGKHTLTWGRCEHGVQPPPTLGHWVTFTADDGNLSIGQASFPLALFLPWAVHLPVTDQHEMLNELAHAAPDNREAVLKAWRLTAGQLADPVRREVLLGGRDD